MSPTNQRIFVHLPYAELRERLEILAEGSLGPEIYLPAHLLESLPPSSLEEMAASLQKYRLPCSIHGPFLDLNAGSRDEEIRRVTAKRYGQAFAAARILRPVQMVLHSGFDRWHYGDKEDAEKWLETSRATWEWALEETEPLGFTLALENVFEHRPEILFQLLRKVNHERLRFCFDIGHSHLFSAVPIGEWIDALAPFLAEIHLHDNLGEDDDHMAIGEGKIDFPILFAQLQKRAVRPQLTIEAFDERRVRMSLRALEGLGYASGKT